MISEHYGMLSVFIFVLYLMASVGLGS